MSQIFGWTGKILRVDLSTGKTSIDDTMKYKDFIGGEGIGYKILWDEVPAGTHPYDPANKLILGAGPLCGSGVPCSGRTTIVSLLPTSPFHGPGSSHMGGYFSVEMKYAGWDAIVLEGKAPKPVWIRIEDNKVKIEDARWMWGKGIFDTMAMISSQMGKEAQVAAIGPAGENQLNMAVIRTGTSHSAGGHGGILGAKNVKAVAVKGTGSVKIAAEKAKVQELDKFMMSIIGANNQMVVPSHPQPWAEFNSPGSRWTGRPGLFWGAANPPVETGVCDPKDMQSVGFRTQKAVFDLGAGAEKYTVRMGGCAHCPIRCHSQLKVPQLEKYGMDPYVSNTCVGWSGPRGVMAAGGGIKEFDGNGADSSVVGNGIGTTMVDDLGVWCNYGQIGRDVKWFHEKGVFKRVLPAEEYASIPWDLLLKGDPRFLIDFYDRVAHKKGELWHIADGSAWIAQRWGLGDDYWDHKDNKLWTRGGYPVHHSNESAGQVGALISCFTNRDAQNHTHQNFIGSQLPIAIQKEIAGEIFGSPDALDPPQNYTRMNEFKARFVKWALVRGRLHDSLTLCNWMWPMAVSPLKERKYRGDTSLEAQFFSAVTGVTKTEAELDKDAERVVTLFRALTVRAMGTVDMRGKHDAMNKWIYTPDKKDGKEIPQFTKGTIQMEKDDLDKGLGMVYKQFGWDEKTGAPTKAGLEAIGLKDVADELGSKGLLPA
ncbi:MAG TPA: aldehyde ferredoxin oxidoreductase [Spirochaetales bacterium]|nr:aldehyde ferredoxin oxidoreductase [Spirochaetales bacterium]